MNRNKMDVGDAFVVYRRKREFAACRAVMRSRIADHRVVSAEFQTKWPELYAAKGTAVSIFFIKFNLKSKFPGCTWLKRLRMCVAPAADTYR